MTNGFTGIAGDEGYLRIYETKFTGGFGDGSNFGSGFSEGKVHVATLGL